MCGIAGAIDLSGNNAVPAEMIHKMAQAIIHRGPDEDGFYLDNPQLGFASRRLSIVGLADGRQPITNEDKSVVVVYNGELFDYPQMREELQNKGHQFRTSTDTEVIPHYWEEYQEGIFDKIEGQFAFALFDRNRQKVILARDRFGICPLYWTRQTNGQGDWLLFASEIRGLLASGMVTPKADLRGLNHLFSFFAIPGPVTCFEGINLLIPGHYLKIDLNRPGHTDQVTQKKYWEIDFPDKGDEIRGNGNQLVEEFESLMLKAVEKRLRADVPVVSYLSGGVDSGTVVSMASHVRKQPIPSFTIRIDTPELDETSEAAVAARHIGTEPIVVNCGADEILNTFPRLIYSAESPVIDTSCAALLLLAQEVNRQGYKVALTGEGADEWLAGYPWFKVHKMLSFFDMIPGINLSMGLRRLFVRFSGGLKLAKKKMNQYADAAGGHNAYMDVYGLVGLSKLRFFHPDVLAALDDHVPYNDIQPNLERVKRWHPFNRSLYYGGRIHLPGLLLNAKGDRVAMHSSLETRYPFLDKDVFDFLAKLHPSWKLKRFTEKFLLRKMAERWLPKEVAWRRKAMFRAPFDSFHLQQAPPFVNELLSEESLRKTGYFNVEQVQHWRTAYRNFREGSHQRTSIEMGLAGVVSTQLWHHTFIDDSLMSLPGWRPEQKQELQGVPALGSTSTQ